VVDSDDKQYEKKDRSLNEPLQFYSGKEPALFEIVVNSVGGRISRSAATFPHPRMRRLRLLLNNRRVGREHEAVLILEREGEVQAELRPWVAVARVRLPVRARVPLLFVHAQDPERDAVEAFAGGEHGARESALPRSAVSSG